MHIKFEEAVNLINSGSVIAIPTDTVYGLACGMHDKKAINKIYNLKGRPKEKPFLVLISNLNQLYSFVSSFPPNFDELANSFWPGGLTIILPVNPDKVLIELRSSFSTVGFRIPEHNLTLKLIETCGPIVGTSANSSGSTPATNVDQVEKYFGYSFPTLDGGQCSQGIPSTIISYEHEQWKVLREGAVSKTSIDEILYKNK